MSKRKTFCGNKTSVSCWRTDGQTPCHGIVRAMHTHRAVKITILDEYLVDCCWIVTYDYHLHGAYSTWVDDRLRYKQDPLKRSGARHASVDPPPRFSRSCLRHKPTTIRRRQIVQKYDFWLPHLETPKDIATKSGEGNVRDRALPSCKFSRRLAPDICHRAKKHIFPYRRLPWDYCPIRFWKAVVKTMLRPFYM